MIYMLTNCIRAIIMVLKHELKLKKDFSFVQHEALLSIYYTASMVKKTADGSFKKLGLTDVQFNVLVLLHHQSQTDGGLSQAALSEMMLVNRANITTLIDRMERSGLVKRTEDPNDRRFKIIKMTKKGREIFDKVDPIYASQVRKMMSALNQTECKNLIELLGKVRDHLGC